MIFFSQIRARIRIYGSQISETNVDRTSEVWEGAGSICFVGISCVPIPGVVLHGFAFLPFWCFCLSITVSTVKKKTWRKCNDQRPAARKPAVPKPTRSRRKFPVNCRKAYDEPIRTSESRVKAAQRSMDLDVWQINGRGWLANSHDSWGWWR